MKLTIKQPLGKTGLTVPQVVYGTSYLGNLYTALPYQDKLALMEKWFECTEKPVVIDSAGKYGAGLALEMIGKGLADTQEEVEVEVGQRPATHECHADQAVQGRPHLAVEIMAAQVAKPDVVLLNASALAPRLLALCRAEGRQELVEVGIAAIVPVKLAVLADAQPSLAQRRQLFPGWKQDVQR